MCVQFAGHCVGLASTQCFYGGETGHEALEEFLNFSLWKVTRNKSTFPDDDSIYKVMYLAIKNMGAQ